MNKIYKVIWSKTRNCYVAAAEFVKRNGKGASSLNSRHIAAVLATVVLCAAPVNGWANDGGIDLGTMYVGSNPDYSVQIDSDIDKEILNVDFPKEDIDFSANMWRNDIEPQ